MMMMHNCGGVTLADEKAGKTTRPDTPGLTSEIQILADE